MCRKGKREMKKKKEKRKLGEEEGRIF